MRDLVLVAAVLAFFGVCVAYVRACDWIMGGDVMPAAPEQTDETPTTAGSLR